MAVLNKKANEQSTLGWLKNYLFNKPDPKI
jgi:hypothetical protein